MRWEVEMSEPNFIKLHTRDSQVIYINICAITALVQHDMYTNVFMSESDNFFQVKELAEHIVDFSVIR